LPLYPWWSVLSVANPAMTAAPLYIAGAAVLVFSVVFSVFGHRRISFAEGLQAPQKIR
jgi:hypothetical protein